MEKLLRIFELFCWWEVKLAYRPASYLNVNLGSLNSGIKRGIREEEVLLIVEFILRPTVSRPVPLGIGLTFGAHDQILSISFL
jgi:hypothetical protein